MDNQKLGTCNYVANKKEKQPVGTVVSFGGAGVKNVNPWEKDGARVPDGIAAQMVFDRFVETNYPQKPTAGLEL